MERKNLSYIILLLAAGISLCLRAEAKTNVPVDKSLAPPILEVTSLDRSYDLNHHAKVFADPDRRFRIEDIAAGKADHLFTVPKGEHWGEVEQRMSFLWIKIKIDFGLFVEEDWRIVHLHNKAVGGWSVIERRPDGSVRIHKMDKSENAPTHDYSIELTPSHREVELVIAVDTPRVSAHFMLMPEELENQHQLEKTCVIVLLCGVVLAVLFYNLTVFLSTWDRSYLYYSLVILSAMAFYGTMLGLLNGLFPQDVGGPTTGQLYALGYALNAFHLIFQAKLLGTANRIPRVHLLIVTTIWLNFIAGAVLAVSGEEQTQAMTSLLPIIFGSSTILSWLPAAMLIRKSANAAPYLLAVAPFLVARILRTLIFYGAIEPGRWVEFYMPIGTTLELVLFGFTLHRRMKNSLTAKVESVTDALNKRNRDLEGVLDHMTHGIFAFTSNFRIQEEYSRRLGEILGIDNITGRDPLKMPVENSDLTDSQGEHLRNILSWEFGSPALSFEMNSHHLPRELRWQTKTNGPKILAVDWSAMTDQAGCVDQIIVTVWDATEVQRLRQETEDQRDHVQVIDRMIKIGRGQFIRYCDRSLSLIDLALETLENTKLDHKSLLSARRSLHTLKGNSLILGFEAVASLAESCENLLEGNDQTRRSRRQAQAHLRAGRELVAKYLAVESLVITSLIEEPQRDRYRDICLGNTDRSGPKQRGWEAEDGTAPVNGVSLTSLAQPASLGIDGLAQSLGKAKVHLRLTDTDGILVDQHLAEKLSDALVHIVRNAIDHGIESPDSRREQGKPRSGKITVNMRALVCRELAVMTVHDDGRGLDLDAIRKTAVAQGRQIDHLDDQSLAESIFRSGFSTREKPNLVSGRGIGLDAVQTSLEESGCSVNLILTGLANNLGRRAFALEIVIPSPFFAVNGNQGSHFGPFEEIKSGHLSKSEAGSVNQCH